MFAKLKVSELKAELKKHGLKTTGKKDILIRRLESFHDADKQPEKYNNIDHLAPPDSASRPRRLSFTGAIMRGIEENKGELKTQVYALLLAGALFYFFYHAMYVHLAIFSAYKEPVMWAFLCSVPINALKDQLKKSLLDDEVEDYEDADDSDAFGGIRIFKFSRLRYCLLATFGIFIYTIVGKQNMIIVSFIFVAIIGIFFVIWTILSITSLFLRKLSPSTRTFLEYLPSDPIIFSLIIFSSLFYPFKCCFRTILYSKFIKSRMASILLICILMITFCIGAFVCVFAIPLEMYGLLQNVQRKLIQYVPEIDSEVLAHPILLSSGGIHGNMMVYPEDNYQLVNFRKFLRRKKDAGNMILKDIDAKKLTIAWEFEDAYVIDNIRVNACLNDGVSSRKWIWESEGLVRDDEEDHGKWVKVNNDAAASTYFGIRIHIYEEKEESSNISDINKTLLLKDICINKVLIHGKMDLLKYVEKATKDNPIVVRLREVKNLIIDQQRDTRNNDGTLSNNICTLHQGMEREKTIVYNSPNNCIITPVYEMRRDCMPILNEGCANVTQNVLSFTNFSFSSINMCYGQVKNCTKSGFKYLRNITESTMDIDPDVLYDQGKKILEASFGKALTFVSVIFDTVYFFFMWTLDSIIFSNVLILLISNTSDDKHRDPVKWVLKSFMTKEESKPLIDCISAISRSYINGVFQTLLRIVLENALLTWLPMYLTGASFSFTISIIAGILSIFGDIFGSLMMLFPIIEIFLHPGNKESDFWKFLVLSLVFVFRFIYPISVHALEKHLLYQQDNRNTILTIVPWSIFGGLQFGLGGIVLGPLISVFPFLMLELREMYEAWSDAKSEKEKKDVLKKYSRK